ncbi:MAG: rhodanese-like domain-containing protein [Planctomycetota bacterium]
MTSHTLHLDTSIAEIMDRYPGACRALFQRFPLAGSPSGKLAPTDSLRTLLHAQQVRDVDATLAALLEAEAAHRRVHVSPKEVADMQREQVAMRLIDVRTEYEWEIARIGGAELLTQELLEQLRAEPKDTKLVFYCRSGVRSLDAVTYFADQGFTDVRSMTGGILAWADDVDPTVPKY